jgi:hypothetical protein
MHTILACSLPAAAALALTALALPAQATGTPAPTTQNPTDVSPAARQKLGEALQKCAATPATAFEAQWGPDQKGGDDALNALLRNFGQKSKVTGAWFDDHSELAFAGDEADQLILRGGRMIAKDDTRGWCRRRGHFADGNTIGYLPDVPALLQQLGDWQLAVTRREVGSLDDRPVEILSVTLNADQVAELSWSGALPPAMTSQAGVFQFAAGGKGGARTAAQPPDSTVDLAIVLDPATATVHEVRMRAWTKNGGAGGMFVVGGGVGRVRVVAGGAGNEQAQEEDEDIDANAPLVYDNGLPKRPRKETQVVDFVLRLTEHGQRAAKALTEEQLRLLR